MNKTEFEKKYPSLVNRIENYAQAFRIFHQYQQTDPEGANRWMRLAENDWSMAVQMAEAADVDLLGAAALFGIDISDPLLQLGRNCRRAMGKPMIDASA